MKKETADDIAWGAKVVAALLFFAAFVAIFRRDLGDPYWTATIFAGSAVVIWLIGRAIVYLVRGKPG